MPGKLHNENFSVAMDSEITILPGNLVSGLRQLTEVLHHLHIRHSLIGGLAVGYRSRPRFTVDVDLVLEIPQVTLPTLLEELEKRGFAFDMEKTIKEWTKEHLTVLTYHGVRIDWLKPILPLYQRVIDKAKTESWLGTSFSIASPEGLILTKLIAARSQDWVDIENLLAANRGELDLDFIKSEWATIAANDDPRMQRFLELIPRFYD